MYGLCQMAVLYWSTRNIDKYVKSKYNEEKLLKILL